MRKAVLLGAAIVAGASSAVAQPSGLFCDRDSVVVGTMENARLTGEVARGNPAMAQAAALVARVDPAQRPEAQQIAVDRLRAAGRYNHDVFSLLLMEAQAGGRRAEAMSGAAGAVAGGIAGAVTGNLIGGMIGADGLGGVVGALGGGRVGYEMMKNLAAGAVEIVLDENVISPVLDDLFDRPCEISAEMALERLMVQ